MGDGGQEVKEEGIGGKHCKCLCCETSSHHHTNPVQTGERYSLFLHQWGLGHPPIQGTEHPTPQPRGLYGVCKRQEQVPMHDAAGVCKEGGSSDDTKSAHLGGPSGCVSVPTTPSAISSEVQVPSSVGSIPDHSPTPPPGWVNGRHRTFHRPPIWFRIQHTGDNFVFKAPVPPARLE